MVPKTEIAWNTLLELRKEILESQRLRTQIVGFKISFEDSLMRIVTGVVAELSNEWESGTNYLDIKEIGSDLLF